jgi:hypothetical protein
MSTNLMDVAARFVASARRRHGDGIDAFLVVARAFADVLPKARVPRQAEPVRASAVRARRKVAPSAPLKPQSSKLAPKPARKPARQPAPESAPEPVPGSPPAAAPERELLVALRSGIRVSLEPDAESIGFGGRETEITARQAQFLVCLAAAAPQPVARDFIARRMTWQGGRMPGFVDQILGTLATELRPACASIGLELKTVRGLGFALAPAQAESPGQGAQA